MHMGSMPGQAKSCQTGLPRRGQEGLHSFAMQGSAALSQPMSERAWRPARVWRQDAEQPTSQRFVAEPTASSADGTAFSASRGADGICTAQPSVNREIVPVQQPPRVVRKAHVFDEMADAWREILEVVSMPVSEPDTPHTPPPDFTPRKEMSCKACDIKFLNFNTWKQHQLLCTT